MNRSEAFMPALGAVSAFLRERGLHGARIAVALSGGADSVCLLHALHALRTEFSLTLSALHVHHGIRGEEADGDERFCLSLCTELGVPCKTYHLDVPALAHERHVSLESAAREARYACFEEYLAERTGVLIATAHQADDNAETLIFRMARGTGLRGLCGIPPVRGRYIRPLLRLSSAEIRRMLSGANLPYRLDSTNTDTAYSRNYIRGEILPRLETLHEGAGRNISLMTETLSEDEMYLTALAEQALRGAPTEKMRQAVAAQPDPVAKRMLYLLYERTRASGDAMTTAQLMAALALTRGNKKHGVLSLPGKVRMRMDGEALVFEEDTPVISLPERTVAMGVNLFPETGACLILSEAPVTADIFPCLNIYKLLIQSRFYFDTMKTNLYVRAKQDGDAYRFGGMTHKLKKLYNDRKLPLSERVTLPVLCDKRGILWVPGFGVREDAAKENKHCIYACYAV